MIFFYILNNLKILHSFIDKRAAKIKSYGNLRPISLVNLIKNAHSHNSTNLYSSVFNFEDRKNLMLYSTAAYTAIRFARTYKLRKLITCPMISLPIFSFLFAREFLNPYVVFFEQIQKK